VLDGQTLRQDFELEEAGFVEGRVINLETAQPAPGARVFVVQDTTIATLTDAEGEYRLSLPPGLTLQIDAFLAGFQSSGPITVSAVAGQVLRGQDFFLTALSGIVQGQVTDGFAPVAGATVLVPALDLELLTDDDGRFEFEAAPGVYRLKVSKECHFGREQEVSVVAGTAEQVTIQLQPLQSVISGLVTDLQGRPIAGARISAQEDTTFTTLANEAGEYELCLDNGIFRVTASHDGYFPADTAIVVNDGDLHTGVNFRLRESFARITGTVQDTAARPVNGAVVALSQPGQVLHDTTDATGDYRFDRVIPGNATVRAFDEGLYSLPQALFLGELQQATVDIVLFPADGFIEGTVRDSRDSTGIPDVTIQALFSRNRDDVFSGTTDDAGHYALTGLPVLPGGTYRVLAFKDEFLSPPSPWTNVTAKSTGIDFFLVNLNGMIAGQVLDIDTIEPLAGVRVTATVSGGGSRSVAVTGTDGRFVLERLAPSQIYTLTATRQGFFDTTLRGVSPGDTSVVLRLARKYGFVEGRVTDLSSGLPMRNVPVQATPGLEGRSEQAVSDANGRYRLRLVPDFYDIRPV
ncbi:MAG: hypothetical protein D6685_11525, partial [Bacteroidetes bacterium]